MEQNQIQTTNENAEIKTTGKVNTPALEQEQEYEYEVDYRDPKNYQIVVALKCIGAESKYQVFDNIPPIEAEPDYTKGDPWAAIRPLDENEGLPDSYDIQIFHLVRAIGSLYARKLNNFEYANYVADKILDALYGSDQSDTQTKEDVVPDSESFTE